MPASHVGVRIDSQMFYFQSGSLLMCLGNCPSAWAPATHQGALEEAPPHWLWPGPALAIEALRGMNQQTKDISLCLLPFCVNSAFRLIS